MSYALIGTGKTGKHVQALLPPQKLLGAFNRSHPPTLEKLRDAEAIIVFVPGENLTDLLPLLLASGKPVISGVTGFSFPENFKEQLLKNHQIWIQGNNFSITMCILKNVIQELSKASSLIPELEAHLHEEHHQHKKDSPSGTALRWQNWWGKKLKINSVRKGEQIGLHTLTLLSGDEKIQLTHEALGRDLFARGALWAADLAIKRPPMKPGFYHFEDLVSQVAQKGMLL